MTASSEPNSLIALRRRDLSPSSKYGGQCIRILPSFALESVIIWSFRNGRATVSTQSALVPTLDSLHSCSYPFHRITIAIAGILMIASFRMCSPSVFSSRGDTALPLHLYLMKPASAWVGAYVTVFHHFSFCLLSPFRTGYITLNHRLP